MPARRCAVTGRPVIPARVRDALAEVIDPDLGVNIVDLGFASG
ncbi:MAG TPA: iron-sulfur cluster assembly protein [Streptosporangiaceae bacterium]|nr:iron-sulfur cluster assembly protein [Streptosporangiaceae bacterium]